MDVHKENTFTLSHTIGVNPDDKGSQDCIFISHSPGLSIMVPRYKRNRTYSSSSNDSIIILSDSSHDDSSQPSSDYELPLTKKRKVNDKCSKDDQSITDDESVNVETPQKRKREIDKGPEIKEQKIQRDFSPNKFSPTKVKIKDSFVKLLRDPLVEAKLREFLEWQGNKQKETKKWPGLAHPTYELLETLNILERLIKVEEQFIIDSSSSEDKLLSEDGGYFSQNCDHTKSLDFNGIEYDPKVGPCHGWEKGTSKFRDRMHEVASTYQSSICLQSRLDHAYLVHYGLRQVEFLDIKISKERVINSDDSLSMEIQEHLKDLLGFVANNPYIEPSYSSCVLTIIALMSSSKHSLTTDEIIQFIMETLPYYNTCSFPWINSLQQTLQFDGRIKKVCESNDFCPLQTSFVDHSGCWTVDQITAVEILHEALNLKKQQSEGNITPHKSQSIKITNSNMQVHHSKLIDANGNHAIMELPQETNNNQLANVYEESNICKVKRHKIEEWENQTMHNKLHLIIQAAENIEIQYTQETCETSQIQQSGVDTSGSLQKKGDINQKIHGHLQELMERVADNPTSMEPPYTYVVLTVIAIISSGKPSLSLANIFQNIQELFPYYRKYGDTWMETVKCTINWHKTTFIRVCQSACPSKKSQSHDGCWSVDKEMAEGILARAVSSSREKEMEISFQEEFNDQTNVNTIGDKHFMASIELPNGNNSFFETNYQSENKQFNFPEEKYLDHICENASFQKNIPKEINNLESDKSKPNKVKGNLTQSTPIIESDNDASSDSGMNCKEYLPDSDFTCCTSEADLVDKNISNKSFKSKDVPFFCQDCNNVFLCLFYLKHHICTLSEPDSSFACYTCHITFTTQDELRSHLITDHKEKTNEHSSSPLCWTLKNSNILRSKNYCNCMSCPAKFPSEALLEAHIKFVHN